MLHFFRFLFSRSFLWQLFFLLVTLAVFLLLVFYGLHWHTRQGNFVYVPDLQSKSIAEVETLLDEKKLNFEVIDSARFNPAYQPFAVIEQTPLAGEQVKKNRKIYLTLNPANYNEVRIPDVIQITRRSAESTLRAIGLEIGEISYIDNIGKDMVLQLRYDNTPIAPGEKLPKTSRVDLVLGNGIRPE